MMRIVGAVLLGCAVAAGQAAPPVPVEQESSHKEILRNGRVRVFLTELPPHAANRLHRHERDHLAVVLADAHISSLVPGQAPAEQKVRMGEARMVRAPLTHTIRNDGDTAFRAVIVEFSGPQGTGAPSKESTSRYCNPGSKTACVTEDYLFCTSKMCASDVTFGPGAVSTRHSHSTDHMLIAVSDYELTDQIESKGKVVRSVKSGDVEYIPAGITHQLTNTGKAAARFIVVVFR